MSAGSVRSVVMWLLLLALPLQGFAAATMLNCGPNHHRLWEATMGEPAAAHDPAAHGHHRHETGRAGGHHEVASVADSTDRADLADDSDASSVHQLNKLTKFKCSACAACCMGAALPTSALVIASPPTAQALTLVASAPPVAFLTDGLDRPPRLPLA